MEELRNGTGYYSENIGFTEWNTLQPNYPLNTSNLWYDADSKWSGFSTSITNDNSSILNQMGHGDITTPFSLGSWETRINTKPFFGYSQACLGGRFHDGTSGCERLLCQYPDRNAFAIEINTGYGYGDSLSTQGPNQQQQKMFYDYFFNSTNTSMGSWQLGKAHAYSKNKMGQMLSSEDRVWTYAFYSTNLFGDPAITLQFEPLVENQVIILSLENGTNGTTIFTTNPTINWSVMANTSQYWLQISNNSAFTDLVVNITNITSATYPSYYTETSTTISFILPTTYSIPSIYKLYYIRVRAYVKEGGR